MRKGNLIAIVILILSAFGIGIFLIFPIVSRILISVSLSSMSASVGIIGGADGPTAVLVSSSLYSDIFCLVCAVVSVIVFVSALVYLIKNNRKSDIKSREIKENSNE